MSLEMPMGNGRNTKKARGAMRSLYCADTIKERKLERVTDNGTVFKTVHKPDGIVPR